MNRINTLVGPIDKRFIKLAAACGAAFLILSILVTLHPGPILFDRPLTAALQPIEFPGLDGFNNFVSATGGNVGFWIGLILFVFICIFVRRAVLFTGFAALYALGYQISNAIIHRPRPSGFLHPTPALGGHSFPSGHIAFFVFFAVVIMFVFGRRLPRPLQIAGWTLFALFIIAAALSRVYVSAHWPTDVIGGFLLGTAWVSLSLAFGRLTAPLLRPVRASRHAPSHSARAAQSATAR